MSSAPRNINRLWAELLIEELVRQGVTHFVVSPGSRSTPLVTALADNPRAQTTVHFDERGTAFHALGLARATARPAAWVTTSGTAAANGLPAVIEASLDDVPLILLTADRPPELRDTGANQTIDQQKLFGDYVRWYFDVPAPGADVDLRFVLTMVDQAVYRARTTPRGPVQLNCMFREPLAPVEDGIDYRSHRSLVSRWERSEAPMTQYIDGARTPSSTDVQAVLDRFSQTTRGIVVAGRIAAHQDVRCVADLAKALNWPLLADVTSQLRFRYGQPAPLPYHALLAATAFQESTRPQALLYFGRPAVSNRLAHFLRRTAPDPYVVVHDGPTRLDPDHAVTHRFDCSIESFCEVLMKEVEPAPDPWIGRWRSMSSVVSTALRDAMESSTEVTEPWVARAATSLAPRGAAVFLGNSMPIRDVDAFGLEGEDLVVFANRGASGIDGNIATAAGACRGSERPTLVLLGDLALLHDLNSLVLAKDVRQPFVVVVVNNDGGGIFSFLPIAGFDAYFERFFGTPHGLRFEHAAAHFGIPHTACESRDAFSTALREGFMRAGPSLIEVRTDRAENVAVHRALDARVADAVEAVIGP